MAMAKCKECKQEVSSKAKVCPHCGVKNPTITAKDQFVGAIILVVIIAGLWIWLSGDSEPEKAPDQIAAENADPQPSQAKTLKGGYGACIAEDLFDQLTSAAVDNDERAINYLMSNGCLMTKAGVPISVLDTSWGTAKVRAYVGDQAVVLWTNIENIQ